MGQINPCRTFQNVTAHDIMSSLIAGRQKLVLLRLIYLQRAEHCGKKGLREDHLWSK